MLRATIVKKCIKLFVYNEYRIFIHNGQNRGRMRKTYDMIRVVR